VDVADPLLVSDTGNRRHNIIRTTAT
jgi:hypothetical protein